MARAYYQAPPPPEIWPFLGIESLDEWENDCDVWAENWEVFVIFAKLSTQWRCGPGGPVGFDYNVARWLFELHDVPDHKRMLSDLRTMEAAALKEMATQHSED